MKLKLVFISIIFLLSLNLVSAEDINIEILESDNEIDVNSVASYKIQITNNDDLDHDFFITSAYSQNWRVVIEPYLVNVPSNYVGTTEIKIYPLTMLNVGTYSVFLDVKSRDKKIEKKQSIEIKIKQREGDVITTELIIPGNIDPRTGMDLKLKLENNYKYDLKDLKVEIKSDIFYKKEFIDLKSNEKTIKDFNIGFDKEVKPGNYNINVEISKNEEILGRVNKEFIVNEFFEVTEKVGKEKGFLVDKIILKKENSGSTVSEERVMASLGSIQRIFSSFSEEPTKIERTKKGYNLEWSFTLDAGEVKEIIITTNYYVLFFGIIAIIIIGFVLFYYGGKKVFVYKTVRKVGKDDEGINYVKIALHVKNKTGMALNDVKIVDYLPKLVHVVKKEFGTAKPNKIQVSRSSGTMRLVWELEGLDRGEERVITYAIRSKMSIIGKLTLPNAVIEYKGKKKFVKVKSNKLHILTREKKKS